MAGETSTSYPLDGELSFLGGQDASKNPDLVQPQHVYSAINSTFKKGIWGPRDAFYRHEITFPEGGISIGGKRPVPYKRIFEEGKFQSIIPYVIGNTPFILFVVSGIMFLVNQDTMEATVIPLGGASLNEFSDRHNWSYASRFTVIFDYPNKPVILEQAFARRSSTGAPDYEVPISTLGAYNENRLFVANAGNEFTGGDPTTSLATPDAPVSFIESLAPSESFTGQIFQLPTSYYNLPITAMGFLQLIDTSTGIGPLIIGTNNEVFAANTQNPRASWEAGPFISKIIANAGIAGQRAMVNVNSDMFFASRDGQVRTLSMSRSEQMKWSKTPISREVRDWLIVSDPDLTKYYSLCYFNNRIYCTANPYRTQAKTLEGEFIEEVAFGGMVALELDNVSTLGQDSPPIWAGLWTGIRPMDFCVNFDRCFVIAKDNDRINSLWEIKPDLKIDTADDKKRLIKSTIYTRSYSSQDPFSYKNIIYGNFPFQEIVGDFNFKVEFKPSHFANYLPWREYSHFAPYEVCAFPNTPCLNGLAPHNLSQLKFGTVETTFCDPVSGRNANTFTKVQFKLEATGVNWELPNFKFKFKTLPDSDVNVDCAPLKPAELCLDCNTDWAIDPFQTCE